MKYANASKLDRKSGVRFGERGGTRLFPLALSDFQDCWSKSCGIPHLAKNERDMGHPRVGSWDRAWGVVQRKGMAAALAA